MDAIRIFEKAEQLLLKKDLHPATLQKVIEEGFSLKKANATFDVFPNCFIVSRNFDDKIIGRVHFENNEWVAHYWYFGGGTTFSGFPSKWIAAFWILIRNATLGEGWDE